MSTRPELGLVDGYPPALDLPKGECVCSRGPDGVYIDHAAPRVLISAELLAEIFTGHGLGVPGAQIRLADTIPFNAFYRGATLRIEGVNRTVVYHITEYVPSVHGYIGEWPD